MRWPRSAEICSAALIALVDDAFDDAHALLLHLAQADRLARGGGQAAHGGHGKAAQPGALDVRLREIVDARPQHEAALLDLLDRAAALQRFEQPVHTAFAHRQRPCQVGQRQPFLRFAQEIQQSEGTLNHRRRDASGR